MCNELETRRHCSSEVLFRSVSSFKDFLWLQKSNEREKKERKSTKELNVHVESEKWAHEITGYTVFVLAIDVLFDIGFFS